MRSQGMSGLHGSRNADRTEREKEMHTHLHTHTWKKKIKIGGRANYVFFAWGKRKLWPLLISVNLRNVTFAT